MQLSDLFRSDRCYRPGEIAEKLSYSVRTVYRMINSIEDPLPAFRGEGNRLRVHGADLTAYLQRHLVDPAND